MSSNVIAIDGPAASGKSSIAAKVSEKLGVPYINTGNMYRAITWSALNRGIDLQSISSMVAMLSELDFQYIKNPTGEFDICINGEFQGSKIRSPEVAKFVSPVAAIPEVRIWLLSKQRELASLGLIVMEGRDIGTVVFPDAEYKFFLTASPLVRAQRRLAQDGETLDGATVESVAEEIAMRDKRDSTRAVAPLKQAQDATLIDSSDMTIDEVLDFIISRVEKK